MAVQYATGFGGLNLVTPARMALTNQWQFIGWDGISLKCMVGTSNSATPYASAGIVTDPTFPSRKLFRFNHTEGNSGPEFIGLGISAGATEPEKGIIFGFTFTESYSGTTPALNAAAPYRHGIAVMSSTAAKTASSSMVMSDPKQCLVVLGDGLSKGAPARYPLCLYGRNVFTRPASPLFTYDINQIHHVEVMIERANKRVRAYVDDQLVQDYTFDGANISTVMQGLQLVLWRDGTYSSQYLFCTDIGNVYMLSMDDTHTDRLGSSARVVDYAPASDRSVQMRNSNDDAAGNYQTASQMFDASSEYSLVAADGGSTDLYGMPQSIYSDAAVVHGVGVKIRAVDIAGGGHKVASVAEVNGKQIVGPEVVMTNTVQTMFSDASINPDTAKKWSVGELYAGSIGMKGGFK